ncbi:hypothetical protein KJS94_12650 [Flavihumibacter rivuli]|uniref:hypothetical protein n=1 Tax=Flavihumibacter rivuli TaxID=2838156 RepID=UPI001BDF2A9F|nr:hypothetical protein [Flavihumibacter rivuli]ULQ55493.1 hypothetical protein KJS94_12650 [Flavihumibacter rivuli]
MSTYLLGSISFLLVLCSCSPSRNQAPQPLATTSAFNLPDSTPPLSILEQPQTEDGAYYLEPGFYEGEFRSYCLQPGTPDPGSRDAYGQVNLTGPRMDIIQSVLKRSQQTEGLDQQNIQLLLWAIVNKVEFNSLSAPVQSTGRQLLTSKQIFELNGGTMGIVRTVASMVPNTASGSDIRRLFELGTWSYAAYEQLAVLRIPSTIHRPDYALHQWQRQPDGYYVRYYPAGYQKTRIQVYVPQPEKTSTNEEHYALFYPASTVIAPANSNAQRLGIGGPALEMAKVIIKVLERRENRPAPQQERKVIKGDRTD